MIFELQASILQISCMNDAKQGEVVSDNERNHSNGSAILAL